MRLSAIFFSIIFILSHCFYMVLLLFYTCNANGILETQKIRVSLALRCWQLRVWSGRAGSLQDQWGCWDANHHSSQEWPCRFRSLLLQVQPAISTSESPQSLLEMQNLQTQPELWSLVIQPVISLPAPWPERPPTLDPLLAALQIHTPRCVQWARDPLAWGTLARVRPLAPRF